MNTIEVVGFSASLLSVLNQFPQAVKVFTTKDTHSIFACHVLYCCGLHIAMVSLWRYAKQCPVKFGQTHCL